MKYVRIPQDRVGVVIGQNGETKKQIETLSKTTLTIDSKEGEILIEDQETTDPLMAIKIENVLRAIGRGFSPKRAFKLFDDSMDFYLFDIHDYVGKKENHVRRLKGRIIGTNGKTKRTIEHLTQSDLSVYGHTVAIISEVTTIGITKKAIDMLLSGSKHFKVYRFIEQSMKKQKNEELF